MFERLISFVYERDFSKHTAIFTLCKLFHYYFKVSTRLRCVAMIVGEMVNQIGYLKKNCHF